MNPKHMDSPNPSPPSKKRSLLGPMVGVGSFLLLIVILAYVNSRLDIIEDSLQYKPPAPAAASAMGPSDKAVTGQTVYVPVYSHVYARGGQPFLLEATLSIRNTDPADPITVTTVRDYDTKGKMIRNHLDSSLRIPPLGSIDFLVEKRDTTGASGANFIVEWVAEAAVSEPLIEAVMIGTGEGYDISFVRPGRPINLGSD